MKRKFSKIAFMASLFISLPALSQTDTLKNASGVNEFSVQEKYRDRNKAWYVNAIVSSTNLKFNEELRYGLGISNEYKLKRQHSLGGGLNILIVDQSPIFSYSHPEISIELKLEYRFYHNLNNRMGWGLNADNFYANYFLISPYLAFGYSAYSQGYHFDFDTGNWMKETRSTLRVDPCLRLGYGLQRPIWKKVSFDVNGGFQVQRTPYLYSPWSLLYFQFAFRYTFK